MKTTAQSLMTVVALTITTLAVHAQDATKPAAPAGSGTTTERRDDRGRGNYEDFRKRMAERLKTSLKVTDDEWTVLQPLIEKVNEKQREAGGSRFGGFGGPGGSDRRRPDGGGNTSGGTTAGGETRAPRPGEAEGTALRTALENESTSPEDLKVRLNAVREVRKHGAAELAAAREDLRKVVTVRQEAVLVSMGILE